jgi:hypothetical protein
MTTTFRTLTGSVYQHKTQGGQTFVRRLSGKYAATPRLVGETSETEWQECATVTTAIGEPAVIAWGKRREPMADGGYPCTITSEVVEIVADAETVSGGEA